MNGEKITAGPFSTVGDIKAANRGAGRYFFCPDAVRFFRSRSYAGVHLGRFFITSEQSPYGERRYTIRRASDDGAIDTFGTFQAWPTLATARAAMRKITKTEEGN